MSSVRAVLFDVDDTLIDYSTAAHVGIVDYLVELGVPDDRRTVGARVWRAAMDRHFARFLAGELSYVGQQHARAAEMIDWLGLPPVVEPAGLTRWFAGYRRHHQAALRPFADVAGCLAGLPSAVVLGVVSNNDEAAARAKLERAGLLSEFRCVVCVDTAGCAKPDPGIFRYACTALGVAPAEAVYVGDRLDSDAVAAVAAGLRGVWLDRRSGGTSCVVPERVTRICTLSDLSKMLRSTTIGHVEPPAGDLV